MEQLMMFDDLPRISWGDPDFSHNGFRGADQSYYRSDLPLEAAFLTHQACHGLKAPLGGSTMSRYLEAPDQSPWLHNLLNPRNRHRVQPDSPKLGSMQAVESPWPFAQDYDRQSSPDSTTWSSSSGRSFNHFHSEDHHVMERSYCLSPRSNMFSWNDDHSSGFDPCDSQPHTDGGFADKVACISPGDLQHYPDAQHDHIETELPEFERRPQGEHVWYPHEVEITDADLHSESRDSTATSEDETLLDAEGDDVDEAEQDDCRDDTYEPRKTRSSTMNARRRSAAQPKSKTSPRGHKRTASSSSASNKITKTATSQSSRSRRKTSIKSEPGPDSPGTPTNHHSNGGGGDGNASVARPFPCPLAPYNCASAFGSKNEWKRHISSQHLRLGYWRCDLCADPTDRPNDFNRKDLFTQHLRRMHAAALQEPQPPLADSSTPTKAPPSAPEKSSSLSSARGADGPTGSGSGGASNADAEATIVQRCYRPLREAPLVSSCLFCTKRFEGAGSWEKRVEHVGKHFETERKAGREPAPVGQWGVDEALEAWLEREGMIGRSGEGWEIRDGQM